MAASPGSAEHPPQSTTLWIFSLPEVAVGVVRPGAPVRLRVAPYPDEVFEGEVFFVSPTLDPLGRRIVLKAWVPNPDGRLRAGLFATIEAELERRPEALVVPETAVVERGQLRGLYVVDADGVARLRWVRLGRTADARVEVISGLDAGERYVVEPPPGFSDGTPVEAR